MSTVERQSEVTDINKQKFLAELSKLLTFMYEEDRQDAIAMYAMMFDETEDERKLLQYLISPTRQAVIIARAYNAKERKLQVSTQSKAETADASGEVPEFMHAIFQIRDEVMGENDTEPKVFEDQISLFEEPEEQKEEPEEIPEEEPEAQPEKEPEQPEEKTEPEPADDAAQAPQEAVPDEPEAEESLPADSAPAEAEAQTQDVQPAQEQDEKVDAFLEDYAPPAEVAGTESDSADEQKPEKPEKPEKELKPDSYYYNREEENSSSHVRTELKAKVALLILYIIAAVPLGLAAVILLLAVAITVLAAAALAVSVGVLVVSFAFGGFAVFADILVVLGIAFVVLALGLLLLWIFIWMLGGAIPGTIRGIIALGRRWCYKEVRAE